MISANKTYHKICLFCRKEFEAQKRTTKFCSHQCASRAYKVKTRHKLDLEVNFEDYVKRELELHTDLLNQIQTTLSELLSYQKIGSRKFITPDEYCKLNGISRKTLHRYIKEDMVIAKKISSRKYLIQSDI